LVRAIISLVIERVRANFVHAPHRRRDGTVTEQVGCYDDVSLEGIDFRAEQ
jgi:hypothetical protein